ncbi:hypothetical protein BaRGS_00007037, partial [Batillaria attramentaria]
MWILFLSRLGAHKPETAREVFPETRHGDSDCQTPQRLPPGDTYRNIKTPFRLYSSAVPGADYKNRSPPPSLALPCAVESLVASVMQQ